MSHRPAAPFLWCSKLALQKIERELDQEEAATAKLVYIAMARIACDEDSPEFTKPIGYIATLASVHRRTVERRLPDLEKLKLITVRRSQTLRVNHHYRLATLSRNDATPRRAHRVALSTEPKSNSKLNGIPFEVLQ